MRSFFTFYSHNRAYEHIERTHKSGSNVKKHISPTACLQLSKSAVRNGTGLVFFLPCKSSQPQQTKQAVLQPTTP